MLFYIDYTLAQTHCNLVEPNRTAMKPCQLRKLANKAEKRLSNARTVGQLGLALEDGCLKEVG